MSRCAFITSGGDPFLAILMLKTIENWKNEVDGIYMCYNATIDTKVVDFVGKRMTEGGVKFIYVDHPLGFGIPFNKCMEASNEEYILLLEDDGFIFKPGLVDSCFKELEWNRYQAVGSPRFSCGTEIAEATKGKYNLNYEGVRDVGPNFWPNFFFISRENLMKTDLDFNPKGWKAGDYIKELDLTCQTDQASDTFGWICMQLRNMGLRFKDTLQCHASPNEADEKEAGLGKWAFPEEFGWIHGGSLSSGWNGFLAGNFSGEPANDYGLQEFETRVAWWKIASDLEPFEEIKEFKDNYKKGIDNMIAHYKMQTSRIEQKIGIYKELLKI